MGDVEQIEVEVESRLAKPVLLREVTLQLGVLQEMRVVVSPRKASEQPQREVPLSDPNPCTIPSAIACDIMMIASNRKIHGHALFHWCLCQSAPLQGHIMCMHCRDAV